MKPKNTEEKREGKVMVYISKAMPERPLVHRQLAKGEFPNGTKFCVIQCEVTGTLIFRANDRDVRLGLHSFVDMASELIGLNGNQP
jgi:hypothetical protein